MKQRDSLYRNHTTACLYGYTKHIVEGDITVKDCTRLSEQRLNDDSTQKRIRHRSVDTKLWDEALGTSVEGKLSFREEINRIFSRNNIAYEVDTSGKIKRLAPAVLKDALAAAIFRTGDRFLDEILETAREKFLQPKSATRLKGIPLLVQSRIQRSTGSRSTR